MKKSPFKFIIPMGSGVAAARAKIMNTPEQTSSYSGISDMFKRALNATSPQAATRMMSEAREAFADFELNRFKNAYSNLRLSNPYENMENYLEEETINQQRKNFEDATLRQSQANILRSSRQSAGVAGIASIAQALVQQNQIAQQRSAANVEMQLNQSRLAGAQEQLRIDALEASNKNVADMFRQRQADTLTKINENEFMRRVKEYNDIVKKAEDEHKEFVGGIFKIASIAGRAAPTPMGSVTNNTTASTT